MKALSYKMFFKAFSNTARFEIIRLLMKGPKNVTEISQGLGFEQSRVSHNLKCLEACGFVSSKWSGKNKVYSLDKRYIIPIINNIDKHLEKYSKKLEGCGILQGKTACKFAPKRI